MTLGDDVSLLNRILGWERAAHHAYHEVLADAAKHPQIWPLQEIAEGHRQAIGALTRAIEQLGGEATATASSVWPLVARDRQLKLFEDDAALRGLRLGEVMAMEECRKALTSESRYGPGRTVLESQIVPLLESHIDVLDGYLTPEGEPAAYTS